MKQQKFFNKDHKNCQHIIMWLLRKQDPHLPRGNGDVMNPIGVRKLHVCLSILSKSAWGELLSACNGPSRGCNCLASDGSLLAFSFSANFFFLLRKC